MIPSKCKGCLYLDYDEGDGGDEGRVYTPICTKTEEEKCPREDN